MRLDSDVIAWLKADGRGYRLPDQSELAAATRHASLHERDKTLQNQTAEKKSVITDPM